MNLKKVFGFLSLVSAVNYVVAQDSTGVKKAESPKIKSYSEVITSRAVAKNGLFTVYKQDEKYFFEIPDSLLNRDVLFSTRLAKVPTGSPMFNGEMVNSIIVYFEKASDEKLYVKALTNVATAAPGQAIAKAVSNSSMDPIIMVIDVKARGKNNKSSIVDVTDFFLKDNIITGFDAGAKKNMGLGGVAPDRSFLLAADSYQQNIEVKTLKTYTMGAAGPDASPSVGVTFELSNSVMLLPREPMHARYADPRVGYSTESYKVFSDDQQKVDVKTFIVRQRLEPKSEDIEKYKKGELVEPKEPIVYYVDPATPKQWRPFIIAGINDWNEAFKVAGYKNAIIGKEWPENDTTMKLEDARYKVIRYFASSQSMSTVPKVYDPRSGEILQTYIGWSHSNLQALHDWYFVQASAVDPATRNVKFSNELMGTLIKAEISRMVGVSLGLRNNLIASYATPVEKLRDKNWVENNGISSSIMDIQHYNYVAQPEDKISTKGLIPQIGDYDKWAIKYGYSYTGISDFEKEKDLLAKLTTSTAVDAKSSFKTDVNPNLNDPADPRAQTEDLSNDQVKASEYGIKNLKIVMTNLLSWTRADMDMYDNAAGAYNDVVDWYKLLTRHAYTQLGGTYENAKTVEQSGDVYTIVPKEKQKRALAFLQKEVFQTPTWLLNPEVLNKFSKPVKKEKLIGIQYDALYYVLNSGRLYKMTTETMRYGKENTYTVDELMTDLEKGLWSELNGKPTIIDTYRRSLQKSWIESLGNVLKDASKTPEPGSTSPDLSLTDIPAVVRAHMESIANRCKAAAVTCTDPMTLAHLKYVEAKLRKKLNPKD
ncbi:zinc-dependent metalloprotease [Chitinophagaceae bacterium 26-R-25]|nr:zinc-dependent metalloprotease [Chitinophagaceae bacterium 26-R-25]